MNIDVLIFDFFVNSSLFRHCVNLTNFFFRCQKNTHGDPSHPLPGMWVKETCDPGLWFNPNEAALGEGDGGVCTRWDDLTPAQQEIYKNDNTCTPDNCRFGQDRSDKCTCKYYFIDGPTQTRHAKECPGGLIWDPQHETCRKCENVDHCERDGFCHHRELVGPQN